MAVRERPQLGFVRSRSGVRVEAVTKRKGFAAEFESGLARFRVTEPVNQSQTVCRMSL